MSAKSFFTAARTLQAHRDENEGTDRGYRAHRGFVAATVQYAKAEGISVEEASRRVTEANRKNV